MRRTEREEGRKEGKNGKEKGGGDKSEKGRCDNEEGNEIIKKYYIGREWWGREIGSIERQGISASKGRSGGNL